MKWPKLNLPRPNAARITVGIFSWSQVFLPLIALLASFASAVRTFQAASEIYQAGGASPVVILVVSVCITLAAEGAIFFIALSQERQHIQWRLSKRKRHVTTIKTIWRSIRVRLGREEALTYDQMPESDTSLSILIAIAFFIALVSNFYIGMRPLIDELKSETVQSFISGLVNAPAHIQTDFFIDTAFAIFPPFMALVAGRLNARFASKSIGAVNRANAAQETPKKEPSERKANIPKKGAFERISEHLNEHPEDIKLSTRLLAEKAKVSVGSVHAFKQRSRTQEAERAISRNGVHHDD